MRAALAPAMLLLAGAGAAAQDPSIPVYQPPAGSNLVLEGPIEAAPGHHLAMGDLVMAAGGTIPRHTHSGEEFLYVIGGLAIVSRAGEPDVELRPGQGLRIAPGTVHWGRAGPEGVRAVSSWVVVDGQPLRTMVGE